MHVKPNHLLQRCVFGNQVGEYCHPTDPSKAAEFERMTLQEIRNLCDRRKKCTVTMDSTKNYGNYVWVYDQEKRWRDDLCYGTANYLHVEYTCQGVYSSYTK